MITIYQNRCKELSSEGQKEAKYAMMMGAKKWQPEFSQYYTASYAVVTDDLKEAFELTNLWNDMNKITYLADRGPSSSVGDIFVDWIGQCFIVDNFGFTQIPNLFEV
jgi:hypothetical protein